MDIEKKVRLMNRVLLECNFFYYSDEKNRFFFEELELTIHSSWSQYRSISDSQYDQFKAEYLQLASKIMTPAVALKKITFDVENETQLFIVLNMCKPALVALTWPGKSTKEKSNQYL